MVTAAKPAPFAGKHESDSMTFTPTRSTVLKRLRSIAKRYWVADCLATSPTHTDLTFQKTRVNARVDSFIWQKIHEEHNYLRMVGALCQMCCISLNLPQPRSPEQISDTAWSARALVQLPGRLGSYNPRVPFEGLTARLLRKWGYRVSPYQETLPTSEWAQKAECQGRCFQRPLILYWFFLISCYNTNRPFRVSAPLNLDTCCF